MNDINLFLKLNNQLVDLRTPVVMGILNITPDSFYDGSRLKSDKALLHQTEQYVMEGATLIDVGGYSTRPMADPVSLEVEMKRVSEALQQIRKRFPDILISVDTFRSRIARMVVEDFGVAMINDISGGTMDSHMFETIADLQVAYVLMHTRGTPQEMQLNTDYNDVMETVIQFLEKRVAQLRLLGVLDIVIDPGFGFAKSIEQNYEILNKLSYLKEIHVPLLVGVSRKSMIYKLLKVDPEHALNGTTAVHMLALAGGASILRVHDVKEAIESIQIFKAYRQAGNIS